ncbi:hypothetical protein OsI_00286 [Oryza sativa Indica Group]|uniref:Uncharacterized protein n=1 Tax=Oryza sativa subsp. indica TaxID=39946 RepID=A2WKD6_ORYSI|nr:hypothetical protein OsI_00286 [Oryza sativa Indica Group]
MSLVRRSNVFDPFSLDLWDPFDSVFRSVVPATSDNDTAAFLRKLFIYPLRIRGITALQESEFYKGFRRFNVS